MFRQVVNFPALKITQIVSP